MAWTPSDEEYFQRLSRTSFAPPEAPPVKQNRSAMGDLATDLKRGVQQFPSAVTGLLDIPVAAATGRALVSEGWGEIGKLTGFQPKRWAEEARAEYTPERQRLKQEADAKEGFTDTLGHYLQNPSLIAGVVAESLPSVAAGGLTALGLKSVGALGGIARAGIGEGSVAAGQSMSNMLDEGVDPRRAAGFSTVAGVGVGALGVGGGKLSQQLGLLDPDTLLAGGVTRAAGTATRQPLSMPRRIAGGAVSEGLFEELPQSMLETSMGNLAAERPWDEDLGKSAAVGLLAGGAMGGVVNIPGARRATPEPQSPDPNQDVAGLLPPPTYTGTPSDQLLQQDVERANRVAEADARAAEIAQRRREFEAQRAAGMALAPEQQTVLEQDPAITAWAATPDAAPHLKKDGTMRSYAAKAWQAYNEMTDAEIVSAVDELAPQPKALWRVGMLEAIQAARQEEANAAPQVDAPSDLGAGTDLVRSTADTQPGPDVGRGARAAAGVPARSGGEAAPVGTTPGEQPAGVAAPSDLMVPETAIAPAARVAARVAEGTVALPKLAPRQQEVFDYIQDAVLNDRADEIVDAAGTLRYQNIGTALSLDRSGVRKAVNGALARVAAANGATLTEFKQALAARARAKEPDPATESKLGESPAVQDSVLDQQELFGEDAGFGTVESVGGSQIETGEDTEATALAALRADPVAAQRAEEARARHEAAKDWALSQPMAAVAAEDWDYYFEAEGLPKASELTRDQAYEWLSAYAEWKNDAITEEQLVAEGREIAGPGAERASLGAPATDNPQLGDGDAGVRAEPAGTDQAGEAGRAPALGQPAVQPIEGRVAELRARANDKQRARLDRLIQRFANREFDLERLNLELDTLEAQLPQLSANVPTEGTTTDAIWSVLNEIGTAQVRRKVTVVQGYEVLVERGLLAADVAAQVQGFVLEGKAYLIADNIAPGSERAVILHEIGAHMGLEKLLSDSQYNMLVGKISQWSDQDTQEGQIARRALVRMAHANVPPSQARSELIAYFIEEAVLAGVNPTAMEYKSEIGRWFRTLWAAFKTAIRRLGIVNAEKLTAQDVVNLAYGAARLELNATYHGTAADFRRFDHRFMGSGEGRQAFGWGTYLAQRYGIAKTYWEDDVRRKGATPSGAFRVDGEAVQSVQEAFDDGLLTEAEFFVLEDSEFGDLVWNLGFEQAVRAVREDLAAGMWRANQTAVVEGALAKLSSAKSSLDPEGNIHHVDVNFTEDEMLDWNKPLSEQSDFVKTALTAAGLGYGEYNSDVSGASFYEDLTNEHGSDKAASEYLDSLGVKGIKFLDQPSRNMKDTATLKKRLKAAKDELAKLEERGPTNQMWYQDVADLKNEITRREAELADAEKQGAQTRNLVVFNDKNIYRVSSQRGGPDGSMSFSIRADVREAIDRNPGLKRAETAVGQTFKAAMRNGLSGIAFTADVVRAAVRSGMSAARDFELALRAKENRAREIQIEVEDVLSAYAALPKVQQGYVDNIVYDMTFEEKWGFVPDWRQDAELDEDMARRFGALAPAAQKVTIDLFRHGDTMFRRKQDLLRQTIAGEYQALITQATDAKQKAELIKARDAELRRAGRNLSALKGPYAPLRRFGDYVVVAKSQKLRDAEAAGKTLSETDMQDSNHYQVHFAPTAATAEQLRQTLAAKFGEEGVWHGLKEEAGGQMPELPFVVVQRLRENLRGTGELESKSKRALDKLLVDLYISTLHESNARHAELQRRNRAGASKDMMRAFASQGRADSHLVSSMEHSSEIIKAMTALRSQAKQPGGDTVLKTKLRNELIQRHMMGLDYSDTPLSQAQDKLMAINSLWMLLTSPAYYVQNATQVFLMTQPVLAARFGQMRSANALLDGARRTFETLKQSTWDEAADLSKFKGTDLEKAMLQELQKRGSLDFGISAELGYWESSGEFSKAFSRVMRKFSIGTRKLEVMNRMTSALAAYQMAYSTTQGTDQQRHSAALEYADRIIVDTHGDYSTQNAPRYFRMLPKILTQFRKFQLIQISLFARHLRDATKGSADEKKVAKAALAYLVMNHAVLAGGLGIPAAAMMAAVYSALAGDDDDPADFEVDLRRAIGNKDIADLLLYGAPAALGVNMSQRIGAGQMLDPLPFVEYEASRGGYEKVVTAALGPMIGGLGPQVFDAAVRITNGELYQGLAQMMPRGLRDAMRGVYASQEGVKLRNGQTALTPEELSFYDSLMMGLGIPTDKTTSRQNLQRKAQQYEEFYRGRTTSLKREYTEAYNAGDGAGMQQARRDWQELQQARKANGFATQPISELLKAPRERVKAEQKLEAGVRTTEQGRGFVQSLL